MKPASYPHTHSRDARYAQQRCAPAVDMTGWGQLLRTCPHPLDNPLSPQREADISTLQKSGHFYFALTEVTGTASSRRAGSKLLVTLMVDGKQAEALQLASEHGDISLALRNPTDNVNVEEDPTLLNEGQIAQLAEVMEAMVKEQEKAEKAEAAKEPEVASPPPEPEPKRVAATTKRQVTIQVIRGSKSETLSLPIKSN